MGLERYTDAIECFRKVLSQPAAMVHQVHLDAWHKVSLLNYIVHGEPFDTKTSGIGSFVLRTIEMEESKRLHADGMQGMQDAAFFEEAGIARSEDENKWY